MLQNKIQSAHPVYYVADLERSRRFYCDLLGFPIAFEIPEAKLIGVQFTETALLVLCQDPSKVNPNAPVYVLNISDVDSVYAALSAKGLNFLASPTDEFYGRAVDFKDPDGYLFCLVSS